MPNKMLLLFGLACFIAVASAARPIPCSGIDCVRYRVDFAGCTEVTKSRTRDCRWHANYNRRADEIILRGTIIAYKIKWFSGPWSGWYVPGHNDIDVKFNRRAKRCSIPIYVNSLRRMWSYFYDHTHKYIICK